MEAFDLRQALEDILLAPAPAIGPMALQVGSTVGARRWPYCGNHPDNWLPPYRGLLLAHDDVRAWRGSVLGDEPSQAAVDAHLAAIAARGALGQSLAVLWEFNPERAYWEFAPNVVPYDADVANWERERAKAKGGGHALRPMQTPER